MRSPLKTAPPYTLVGVDIAGEWNRPLLANAAAISGCPCSFTRSALAGCELHVMDDESLEVVLQGYQRVIACETAKSSVSIYDFPAPRERTAILVGNEEEGLASPVLKRADSIVCIPMAQTGLSSVNVAVAAAISLYAFTRDLGRKKRPRCRLRSQDVDVLIEASADPHELGSLLRSVYAFGWRRVFVSDPHGVWFTDDPRVIVEGRAAARRAKNLLTVLPAAQLEPTHYDAVLVSNPSQPGQALSRLRLPACRRLLVVLGSGPVQEGLDIPTAHVTVDFIERAIPPRARHTGSILLSMIATLLDD